MLYSNVNDNTLSILILRFCSTLSTSSADERERIVAYDSSSTKVDSVVSSVFFYSSVVSVSFLLFVQPLNNKVKVKSIDIKPMYFFIGTPPFCLHYNKKKKKQYTKW